MSFAQIRWKAKVMASRLRTSARYLCHVPFIYKNWVTMLTSKSARRPSVLRLRDGSVFEVRPRTTDRAMLNEIFIGKPYCPSAEFAIGDEDRVLDIGANIGVFTVYAARRARRGCVIAVEPVSANFSVLERNVGLNALGNVRLRRVAAGSHAGSVKIASAGAESSVIWINDAPTEEVQQVSLASLVEELGEVDFLKLDCEGAEFDILLNSAAGVLGKVRRIAMEYHNVSAELTAQTLKQRLQTAGFDVTVVGSDWTGLIYAVNRKTRFRRADAAAELTHV